MKRILFLFFLIPGLGIGQPNHAIDSLNLLLKAAEGNEKTDGFPVKNHGNKYSIIENVTLEQRPIQDHSSFEVVDKVFADGLK